MPQYLVASYLADNFDPSSVTEAMVEEIHALNRELIAAGVRKFACGISPASNAKTVRKQADGTVLVTDGPYIETKEHIGGFWILECANLEEALAWARKGAISCDAVGEVRELLFYPAPEVEPVERKETT
ncbi:MAG TPA: YciI family protein [Candidatus Saccharimonadales bacterium]|nr:YciI family protein [Candidatus Saccharimonadales bacterium]